MRNTRLPLEDSPPQPTEKEPLGTNNKKHITQKGNKSTVIKSSVGTYGLPSRASILYQHGNHQRNSVGCVGISRIPSRLTLSVPTAVLMELCHSVSLSSA